MQKAVRTRFSWAECSACRLHSRPYSPQACTRAITLGPEHPILSNRNMGRETELAPIDRRVPSH